MVSVSESATGRQKQTPRTRDRAVDVTWYRVTSVAPCPVCRRDSWCYYQQFGDDPLRLICMRIESDYGLESGDGWYHDHTGPVPVGTDRSHSREPIEDRGPAHAACVEARAALPVDQRPDHIAERRMGLLAGAYTRTFEVGAWVDRHENLHLSVPEVDDTGMVVGWSTRRVRDDKKLADGHRGLTVPKGFAERAVATGTVYIVEGASDVVALNEAGLCAIGTPGAGAAAEYLAEYLQAHVPGNVSIVVMMERDGAGQRHAPVTAQILETRLQRPVSVCTTPVRRCPNPIDGGEQDCYPKDARGWLGDRAHPDQPDWLVRGKMFALAVAGAPTPPLAPNPQTPPTKPDKTAKPTLSVEWMTDIQFEAVDWLVEGRIPLKMVTMIFAPGGSGKSTLVRSLIADVSRGRCAFGETYDDPKKGGALILSAEDHPASVIGPGLAAAGADMGTIAFVKGAKSATDGKERTITLCDEHVELIESHLDQYPHTRIVVIDPVTSYVGAVDDWKASELKPVLDRLKRTAESRNVAVILVGHTNKNQKAGRLVDRLAGSKAYSDTCRANYVVDVDPDDEECRVARECKHNLIGIRQDAIVFRQVEPDESVIGRVAAMSNLARCKPKDKSRILKSLRVLKYEEPRYIADEDLLAAKKPTGKRAEATQALTELLDKQGVVPVADIDDHLTRLGYGKREREGAKSDAKKNGVRHWRPAGNSGGYVMGYRSPAPPTFRPPVDPLAGLE